MTEAPSGETVDVTRLMEEIRERVRERKASGFYSEEEVRRITQMELEITGEVPGLADEIEQHLARLNDTWDTAVEPTLASHRPWIGPLIVGAKRALRRLTRPYVSLVLAPQVAFNGLLVRLLNAFALPVRDELRGLARKTEELSLGVHERLAVERQEALRRHRDLAGRVDALVAEVAALRAAAERGPAAGAPPLPPPTAAPAGAGTLPAAAYLAFEDRHRGTREEIRERQRGYLALFEAGPVLDAGCGRGEFLELCREVGLEARGVDADPGMVARCRAAGLEVEQGDLLTYLGALADGSLGGVFCAQVIEHLPPEALVALVRLAFAKLRPGGLLVCETPNPACLSVFAGAFYADLTHVKPIHPGAAAFVLEAAGFREVEIRYANPCPPEARLLALEPLWYMRRYEEALLQVLNDNFARLNDLLWGAQDYAVVGRKP